MFQSSELIINNFTFLCFKVLNLLYYLNIDKNVQIGNPIDILPSSYSEIKVEIKYKSGWPQVLLSNRTIRLVSGIGQALLHIFERRHRCQI